MGRDTVEKLYSWLGSWRLLRVGVVRLGVFLGARPWAGLCVCLNDAANSRPGEPEVRLAALAARAAALLIWDVRVMRQVVMSTHAPSLHRLSVFDLEPGRVSRPSFERRAACWWRWRRTSAVFRFISPCWQIWQMSGMRFHIPISHLPRVPAGGCPKHPAIGGHCNVTRPFRPIVQSPAANIPKADMVPTSTHVAPVGVPADL